MSKADRIAGTQRHIARQMAFARARSTPIGNRRYMQPHRMAKLSFATCGSSRCTMCCNPRKRGELTMHELRTKDVMRESMQECAP